MKIGHLGTLILFFALALLPALIRAEPRILTFDLGFDEVLGLTSIQDRNDLGDMTIASVAGPRSLLLSRLGEATPVACPNSTQTAAKALNNSRHVAGFCDQIEGNVQGFLLRRGVYAFLNKPGAILTEALGVNNGDIVVGDFRDASGRFHGFRWVNGHFTTIDAPFPGTYDTSLTAINKSWHSTGWSRTQSGAVQGFLLRGRTFTPLAVPGAVETYPLNLNDADQAIGVHLNPDGTVGSFFFDGSDFFTVALPGAEIVLTDVASLTNGGVISGRFLVAGAVPSDFSSRGFVLSGLPLERITPVPALRFSSAAAVAAAVAPAQMPLCAHTSTAPVPAKLLGVASSCPD